MLHSRGSRLISLLVKRRIMGIEERYHLSQNLLSAAVIFVLRRLLNAKSNTQTHAIDMVEENVSTSTRKLGYDMCRDSIGGVWSEIDEREFQITHLSGGLTNYLYICSLPPKVVVPDNQPRRVLFRVYGDIATSSNFVVQNSVIFAIMSEKKLGPKLYGMNPKARLEELVPAACLSTLDLHSPTLSRMIAKKLALFHSLDMPLCKEPRFLNNTMDEWMAKCVTVLKSKHSSRNEQFMHKFRNFNLPSELKALKCILSKVQSPVVFSHNDLQEGNILNTVECSDPDKQLTVIDWEYCSYNYRGYDFGNHFLEWCYNYAVSEHPYYSANLDQYPSRQQQEEFFRAYLQENGSEVTSDKLDEMYIEANTYALASHFLWGLWGILQNEMSSIQFGFLEYAVSRFEGYFTMKERLPSIGIHIEPPMTKS